MSGECRECPLPFDYGPYSRVLAKAVNELILDESISPSSYASQMGGERTEYKLTPKGKTEADSALEILGPEKSERLRKLRRGAEQLGYQGILRHVYTKYPEYASASKIREEVVGASYQY